jgi:hypothetical protein
MSDTRVPAERLLNGDTVFYTFATSGYVPFVLNLHASLRTAEPELARCLVAFCADEATAEELRRAGMFAIRCDTDDLPGFADFSTAGWGRVISHKWLLARDILRHAEYAWWCDGDIVAQAPMSARIASLMRQTGCDILMQYEWPGDDYCTGFWIARRGPAVDAMLAEMEEHAATTDGPDQEHFNEVHVGAGRLRLAALNHDEFKCGNRFYFQRAFTRPNGRMLHFNYSIGNQSKKALMMGHGCWFLHEPRSARVRARARHLALVLASRTGVASAETRLRRSARAAGRTRRRLARRAE